MNLREMRDQKRALLAMATGTGKTLPLSRCHGSYCARAGSGRKGQIDRVVLRNQAYNAFGPFASGTSDSQGCARKDCSISIGHLGHFTHHASF